MAYITTEAVKEIRNEIKKNYPTKDGWKISVRRHHYSSVAVDILEAPFEMRNNIERGNEGVNHYHIESHYAENKKAIDVLKNIRRICNKNNFDKSDIMTDYFHVGHYVQLSVGTWDRPFKINKK